MAKIDIISPLSYSRAKTKLKILLKHPLKNKQKIDELKLIINKYQLGKCFMEQGRSIKFKKFDKNRCSGILTKGNVFRHRKIVS